MLTVTETAGARLAEFLTQERPPEETATHLVHEKQGLGMQPDSEGPGDATARHEGRPALFVNAQVSELRSEDTLDIERAKLTRQYAQGNE